MDMGFSKDPYESFKIFQGKIYEEYGRIFKEFPAEQDQGHRALGAATGRHEGHREKTDRPEKIQTKARGLGGKS